MTSLPISNLKNLWPCWCSHIAAAIFTLSLHMKRVPGKCCFRAGKKEITRAQVWAVGWMLPHLPPTRISGASGAWCLWCATCCCHEEDWRYCSADLVICIRWPCDEFHLQACSCPTKVLLQLSLRLQTMFSNGWPFPNATVSLPRPTEVPRLLLVTSVERACLLCRAFQIAHLLCDLIWRLHMQPLPFL